MRKYSGNELLGSMYQAERVFHKIRLDAIYVLKVPLQASKISEVVFHSYLATDIIKSASRIY
jgi:hypothetical protein